MVIGAAAFGALVVRWGGGPTAVRDLIVLGGFFAALTVLLATDLDQRLLPDVITLPMIPLALVVVLTGMDPLLADLGQPLLSAGLAAIAGPLFLAVTSAVLRGGIGMGDLKLGASLGLMLGVSRLVGGFVIGSIVFSAVVLGLLAVRRVGLREVIPFGPALIAGAFIGALLP